MRFPRRAKVFRGQLDPLLPAGVVVLLMVFVLLHSQLVFPPGLPILLPEAEGLPGVTNTAVIVTVDAKGQCYFQHQLAREEDLRAGMKRVVDRARGPVTLVVMADRSVPIDQLFRLGQVARDLGIADARLAVRPTGGGNAGRP